MSIISIAKGTTDSRNWVLWLIQHLLFKAEASTSFESTNFRISTLFSLAVRIFCFLSVRNFEVIHKEVGGYLTRCALPRRLLKLIIISHSVSYLCRYRAARAAKKGFHHPFSNFLIFWCLIFLHAGLFTSLHTLHIICIIIIIGPESDHWECLSLTP